MAKKEEGISEKAVHTKGPWKCQSTQRDMIVIGTDDLEVAEVWTADEDDNPRDLEAQDWADARLIAAAPRMEKALERAHIYFMQSNNLSADDWEVLDEMWNALKEARGEQL